MLLISILIFVVLLLVLNEKEPPIHLVLVILVPPLFFLLLWFAGYSSGATSFFTSDELHYFMVGTQGFPLISDRFLYYLINYWLINHDVYLAGYTLKVLNITFYVGLVLLMYKIFNRDKIIFVLPFVLPYFAYLSIFNMRDLTILFFTVLTIYLYFERKKLILSIISLVLLYLLRPFAAMFLVCIIIIPYIYRFLISLFRGRLNLKLLIILSAISLLLLLAIEPISSKISVYQNWFDYTTGEGEDEHIEAVSGGINSGKRSVDFVISSVRYILTPMPFSLLKRISEGGSETWGSTDDFIRLLSQTGYFLLIIYLLINIRYLPKVIRTIKFSQMTLILSFLSYWPIYSFHLYGMTHQRLKIPFQIVIFLIVVVIIRYKQSRIATNDTFER